MGQFGISVWIDSGAASSALSLFLLWSVSQTTVSAFQAVLRLVVEHTNTHKYTLALTHTSEQSTFTFILQSS